MAASCSYTKVGVGIRKHSWTWVSSSNGVLTGLGASDPISGRLLQAQFDVVSGSEPTADYDVTLIDANGADWLFGQGADLSNNPASASGIIKTPLVANYQQPILDGVTLTPEIANAGDEKSGVINVWTHDLPWGKGR